MATLEVRAVVPLLPCSFSPRSLLGLLRRFPDRHEQEVEARVTDLIMRGADIVVERQGQPRAQGASSIGVPRKVRQRYPKRLPVARRRGALMEPVIPALDPGLRHFALESGRRRRVFSGVVLHPGLGRDSSRSTRMP